MQQKSDHDAIALHAQLSTALRLADELDLTIVAIHIDEARAALAATRNVDVAGGTVPAQMPGN